MLSMPNGVTAPAYHFSVDDVFSSLFAPAETKQTVADQPAIRFLLDLTQSYGTQTDLYAFLHDPPEDQARDLSRLPDFVCTQVSRLEGLRFGPHGRDYISPPHAETLAQQATTLRELYVAIGRFCDSSKLSRWVRLHYFSECYEMAPVFLQHGAEALLLTDKPAITYRLDEGLKADLIGKGWTAKDGLAFIRSHMRFETCVAEGLSIAEVCARAEKIVEETGFVVLFTHEVDLADPRVREMASACLKTLAQAGARSI
jgi:hypothetical protein